MERDLLMLRLMPRFLTPHTLLDMLVTLTQLDMLVLDTMERDLLMLKLMLKFLLPHTLLDMLDTHTQLDMLDTHTLQLPMDLDTLAMVTPMDLETLLLLQVAETTLELLFLANCPWGCCS